MVIECNDIVVRHVNQVLAGCGYREAFLIELDILVQGQFLDQFLDRGKYSHPHTGSAKVTSGVFDEKLGFVSADIFAERAKEYQTILSGADYGFLVV